jgi:hypothetical protein
MERGRVMKKNIDRMMIKGNKKMKRFINKGKIKNL